MSNKLARPQTLQRLRALIKVMLGIGLVAVIYVVLSAGFGGPDPTDDLPSMRVDLSGIPAGEAVVLLWGNRPIIILHRTVEQIEALSNYSDILRDSASQRSTQPDYAQNTTRSVSAEWFIALAAGTDLGCSVSYSPDLVRTEQYALQGSFKDSCRGSLYDLAGRVLVDQHAQKNLIIPDYKFKQGEVILGAG